MGKMFLKENQLINVSSGYVLNATFINFNSLPDYIKEEYYRESVGFTFYSKGILKHIHKAINPKWIKFKVSGESKYNYLPRSVFLKSITFK